VNKNRLEAFSDGVLAIIITIMVLEMKVPRGGDLESLRPILPIFMSYVGSIEGQDKGRSDEERDKEGK
jgi:uncharacterized membrane protein